MSNGLPRPRPGGPASSVQVQKENIKNKAFAKNDVSGINDVIAKSLVLKLIESEKFVIIVYEEVKEPSRVVTIN